VPTKPVGDKRESLEEPVRLDGRHSKGAATPQLHNNFAAKIVQGV
jgi:hypothetical protein